MSNRLNSQAIIEKGRKSGALLVIAIPFLVIAVYFNVDYLFVMSSIIILLLVASHLFLTYVHRGIDVQTKWSHTRLFPNESVQLRLTVRNEGVLALLSATWRFKLSKKMMIDNLDYEKGNVRNTYFSGISLGKGEEMTYHFIVNANQRGVAQISEVDVEINDIFGLGNVTKTVSLPKQEVLIYPEIKPIAGLHMINRAPMGERPAQFFTHEDPTYILGARPYRSGDPFNRIDWKQTARKQELHTKIIDKMSHSELVIIGNVRTYDERWRGINEEYVERSLSVAASVSHYSTKEEIPYQLIMNMKTVGYRNMYRIARGEGRRHLIRTLEALTRVSTFATISFEESLQAAYQEYYSGQTLVVITPYVTEKMQTLFHTMSREGIPLYVIRTDEEDYAIRKWEKRMTQYA